jgi:hypothetical protein
MESNVWSLLTVPHEPAQERLHVQVMFSGDMLPELFREAVKAVRAFM